ncbi:MAG: DNA polymerase III subunit delta [Deltaproteobacteria bacterium]|nr:DNA polymerase III subunit delta [Deltaproteobacteria bacterium]
MDRTALEKDLNSGSLKPVYLLYGQEAFLKERYAARLAESVDERLKEFNIETLLAEENQAGDVVERAQTMPFMAPPRVLVVRGVDRYPAEELSILKEYLSDPNESTCLVLVADKPDFRLGLFKALQRQKLAVSFDPPRGRSLVAWVQETGADRGYKVGLSAARTLIELVGTDLMNLNQELEKVCLYAGPEAEVGEEDVRAAARISHTASIFDLGDAVGEQNRAGALSALKDLLLQEHHLMILAMIARHFRLLLKARQLLNQKASQAEAQRALGLQAWVTRKYLSQARNLNLAQLKKGLSRVLEADLALKTTGTPERLILERLVFDLASLRPSRRTGI